MKEPLPCMHEVLGSIPSPPPYLYKYQIGTMFPEGWAWKGLPSMCCCPEKGCEGRGLLKTPGWRNSPGCPAGVQVTQLQRSSRCDLPCPVNTMIHTRSPADPGWRSGKVGTGGACKSGVGGGGRGEVLGGYTASSPLSLRSSRREGRCPKGRMQQRQQLPLPPQHAQVWGRADLWVPVTYMAEM